MMEEPDHDGYFRYIEDADKREMANADTYDKSLLTLSSALLGISLTFTQNAVPLQTAHQIWCLIFAWGLFALTIIMVIVSIIYGQHCIKRLKDNARPYYLERKTEVNELSEEIYRSIRRLNTFSGVCFIVGVLMFTAFVGLNVYKGNVMGKVIERGQPTSTYQQQQGKPAQQPSNPQQSQQTGQKK